MVPADGLIGSRSRRRAARAGSVTRNVAPRPSPGALGTHAAAVQLDEMADDGEAEAEAAEAPPCAGVGLAEPLEDVGHELGDGCRCRCR